jgi:ATP-dependent DNA helicase RecG
VPGIGPRQATRLAALGLFQVVDLLQHYPRDYLNYANLVRISALLPGSTATVVATVRRCHTATSPKNPNLSFLELHLQDVTGRLKVSRFFAGRRFASPGWLKSQQRLYPPGSTVAVSGLVKEGPWGMGFTDPLIEVLDSPSSPVRSEQIGPTPSAVSWSRRSCSCPAAPKLWSRSTALWMRSGCNGRGAGWCSMSSC